MKPSANNLSVWVGDKLVCIKIEGRASFNCSVDFKTLINSLSDKGYRHFVLDLTNCLVMDSTFLGVLASLGLKFENNRNSENYSCIELLNPNPRIADLLENLGVSHLFHASNGSLEHMSDNMRQIQPAPANASRQEISRTCLEAHKFLMELNPANVPKFKDVAQFLAEDLKRMENANGE